jgi:hypothetical protein
LGSEGALVVLRRLLLLMLHAVHGRGGGRGAMVVRKVLRSIRLAMVMVAIVALIQ